MNDFSEKVTLGHTGLQVSRLGIGSAYGVSEKACRKAFDLGVNYFFWGSVRTPGMGIAIRDISRSDRENLVVVLECYTRHHRLIRKSIEQGLKSLQIEQAEILLLGWYDSPPGPKVMDTVLKLKETALKILKTGPMDQEELERIRIIGNAVHETKSFFSMMNA